MAELFANNAVTIVARHIDEADVSIILSDASDFPSPSGGDYFWLTLQYGYTIEIVKCTARSGNTLTVERGGQGTTPSEFPTGSEAELRFTAEAFNGIGNTLFTELTVYDEDGDADTTVATNEGIRPHIVHVLNNDTDKLNMCAILVDTVQTSGVGTIIKSGVHSKAFTQPDNGGDSSAGLFVQTGGGNGLSVYKFHEIRPVGYANYEDSPQGAFEAATSGQSFSILTTAGAQNYGAHTNGASAIRAQIGNDQSKGLVLSAISAATYGSATAIAIGDDQVNGAVTNRKFHISYNGNIDTAGSATFEKANATCNVIVRRTGTNAVTGILSAQDDTFYVGTSTADQFVFLVGGAAVGMFDTGGRMSIGSGTPDSKAILSLNSTTMGFLTPRMTEVERDAIASPPAGLEIYNTTTNKKNFYNGAAWEVVTSA